MRKILIIILAIISMNIIANTTNAQQLDTISTIVINDNDTNVWCYHYKYNDNTQIGEYISKNKMLPEISELINIVKLTYCISDTLEWVQYQNSGSAGTSERFIIKCKNKEKIAVFVSELNPTIQYTIYILSNKIKNIIRYEN